MLTGFTDEKLYEFRNKCEESYAEKLRCLWGCAYCGEIRDRQEMISELENLNRKFQEEMEDYCTSPWDLTEDDIKLINESDGSLKDIARTKF